MAPVFLFRPPSPALRDIIACHQIIRLRFAPDQAVPIKAYWPRPAMALAFYPRDAERVRLIGDKAVNHKPRAALIGQPTMMAHRQGGRDFSVYQIELCPGALYHLTGIPAHRLTDGYVDAEAVFPPGFRALVDRIEDAEDPEVMIALAEGWLAAQRAARPPSLSPATAWAARALGQEAGFSLDALSHHANMDPRQLRRLFAQHMGISPKLYARVARFDRAIRLHNRQPGEDWLSIAIAAGYYDHQHMARDFRDFTGMAPTHFAALELAAPERMFGHRES